ncbi:MarR family winged helix-turn-helix transcriptional regulator [Risungbinella massiliensis]|uniref:MarR family winged helix-turn-helix transcriptional regulator n=1 Tax=Risungbinella massiliensis TaxID=1329796 RepID=UPI0005CC2090|nr:MarR family transcriptional regulator [Risungbinella massiliensis]
MKNMNNENILSSSQIIDLLIKTYHQIEHSEEQQLEMIQQTQGTAISQICKEMTITMFHVLDVIGNSEPINGIAISRCLEITKGAVSKITKKLLTMKLIDKEMLPDNKKEIFFRLTPLGQQIFSIHASLHAEIEKRWEAVLSQYNQKELLTIVKFLEDVSRKEFR